MAQSVLISGSLAFDYIMGFPGVFKDSMPLEQAHAFNMSLIVNSLQKSWGGTAGNSAYAMKMLGGEPLLASALGKDGDLYRQYLEKMGIPTDYIYQDLDSMTASAYIITDQDDSQITTFFGGSQVVAPLPEDLLQRPFDTILISPSSKATMLAHSQLASNRDLQVVFDPGQQISLFTRTELCQLISEADIIIGNDYEIVMLLRNSGLSREKILEQVSLLVTTLGKEGVRVQAADGQQIEVPACKVKACVDPTGAGDSFRAGFLLGLAQGKSLQDAAAMGNVAAAFCVEVQGTQSYTYSQAEFLIRYQENYHTNLPLN